MREKIKSVVIVVLMALCLCSCAAKEEKPEPQPLVIEKDLKDTTKFKKAFCEALEDKDVSLTVYVDGAEDFNYKGKIKVVEDGLDGKELMLFIDADVKTMESDWF